MGRFFIQFLRKRCSKPKTTYTGTQEPARKQEAGVSEWCRKKLPLQISQLMFGIFTTLFCYGLILWWVMRYNTIVRITHPSILTWSNPIAVEPTKVNLGICGPSLHIGRMGEYMNMSLDSIIALNKIDTGNHRSGPDANRNIYVNRNLKEKFDRPSRDSSENVSRGSSLSPRVNSRMSARQITKNLISIKFLISNELSGSMIGPGGAAIKELMDTTKYDIIVDHCCLFDYRILLLRRPLLPEVRMMILTY